jgi:putative phage-type endonuclease
MSKLEHPLFGKAVLIGDFENQSPEWHELRSKGIGGSQVGTVLGLNQWESAYTLWAKLSGKIPESFEQNEKMYWGTVLEPVIREEWLKQNPNFQCFETGTWADGYRHANPDGILLLHDATTGQDSYGLLEIKTAGYRWDVVPPQYVAQCQWYMHLLGLKWCALVVLFQGNTLETFDIPYDPEFVETMLARVDAFWAGVQADNAPNWDGSESTYQTVRAMHPDIVDDEVELGQLGVTLLLKQAALDHAQEELNQIKSIILDFMGKAKYGLVDGKVLATRSSRSGGTPYLTISKKG